MGVGCQIVRDDNGSIINVEATNGETSVLYKDLQKKAGEQALELWAYSYTPEFENLYYDKPKDINNEHLVSTVINSLFPQNLTNKIRPTDLLEIIKFNVGSINELDRKLSNLFIGNRLVVNYQTLKNTALFDDNEISHILKSNVKNDLNELVIKVRALSVEDEEFIDELPTDFSKGFWNGEYSKYGKKEYININIEDFVGLQDNELDNKVLNSGLPLFIDRYFNDESYQQEFRSRVSSLMKVPIEINGKQLFLNDTEELLKNTVLKGVNNKGIIDSIATLRDLSYIVWQQNIKEVNKLLNYIKERAFNIGIDLPNFNGSMEETKELLDALEGFTDSLRFGITNLNNFKVFTEIYDRYYGVIKKPAYKVVNKQDKVLTYFEDLGTEIEAYNKGYILVEPNIYQKVDTTQDIQSEFLKYVKVKKVLPENIDVNNDKTVMNYINSLVNSVYGKPSKEATEIIMLKIVHGNTLTTAQKLLPKFDTDESYLTTDFLHDFRKEQIKNPIYSVFEIRDKIYYSGGNETELNTILSPMNTLLMKYSRLSKDLAFNNLFPNKGLAEETIRELYKNNPSILPNFNGEYEIIDNKLLTYSQQDFIRLNDIVFEKSGSVGNKTAYSVVDSNKKVRNTGVTLPAKEFLSLKERIEATKKLNSVKADIEC